MKKNNQTQKHRFLPWERVESIALIIGKNESLNKSAIDKFIENTDTHTVVFYVEPSSKQPSYADWHCFTKKEATWLKLPKSTVIGTMITQQFDLVINTSHESDLFAIALCSALPATFKCASSEKHDEAQLIIQRKSSGSLVDYLNDTLHYLKMIRV